MDLYEEIVRLRREGKKAVVATIVRHLGSTPRKDHAKMLIYEDGSSLGSVGGGKTEAQVLEAAQQIFTREEPVLLQFRLTQEDAQEEGLTCGGTVEVFLEPIRPEPRLILMGGGHLGQAVANVAHDAGFHFVVVDDREAFASRERFPLADEIVVGPFEQALKQVAVYDNSFILIATRGHASDQVALEQALQTPARYIGMVGSRRKIQIILEPLLKQGVPPQEFSRFYAPIGIEIGSQSPEEIAISTVAELIAISKGVHQRSEKQLFALKVVEKFGRQSQPSA